MTFSQFLGLLRSLVIYYQPHRTLAWKKFYRELVGPGQIAFDVGAHVGSRSRILRSLGAKVIAIEPQEQFAKFLSHTLPKNVVLIQAAVGPRSEQGELKASSKHPTVSSMKADFVERAASSEGFERVDWDQTEIVQVVTLDQLILEHGKPHYVKIDVEGFELEVLQGLSEPIDLISFEYLPQFKLLSHEVIDKLMELGHYSFNAVVGEKASFIWDSWQDQQSLKSFLETLNDNAKSGDVYARLNRED